MENKDIVDGEPHSRPCFFAFADSINKQIIWLVPISSKHEKYKNIFDKNMNKYGRCEFIRFGEVLGTKAVFLIQNICPVTQKYIKEIYVDKNNKPILIDDRIVRDVVSNARATLAKVYRGVNIVFTNVSKIKKVLIDEMD
jgi:methylaspartate ammonia-lyase